MHVHSVEETPPRPLKYEAYLPIADEDTTEPDTTSSAFTPFFDVDVLAGDPTGPSIATTYAPRFGIVTSLGPQEATGDFDMVVSGRGSSDTVLRVPSDVANYLTEDSIIIKPLVLATARRGVRLRKVQMEFVPDTMQEPWESDVWLPVARLHRPDFAGCVTTYTVTSENVDAYDASFEFAGLGLGGSVSFAVTFERQYPASESCKEAKVAARVSIVYGTTLFDGEPVSDGTRVSIFDVQPKKRKYADIAPTFDQCGWELSKIPKQVVTDEDLSEASGGRDDAPSDTKIIDVKSSGKMTLGVTFGRAPVNLSASFSRTCEHTVAIKTKYMPGARYIGYQPHLANEIEKCWSVLGPAQELPRD